MKKIILPLLLLISLIGISQPVSRATLTTSPYGWGMRQVPPLNNLQRTFLSFHSIVDDGAAATATNAMAFTNKTGNISQWTNNTGYVTSTIVAGYIPYVGANSFTTTNGITAGTLTSSYFSVLSNAPSFGFTTINAQNTSASGIGGIFQLTDDLGNIRGGLFNTNSNTNAGDVYTNSSLFLETSSSRLGIGNYNASGNILFYCGGFSTASERFRITTTGVSVTGALVASAGSTLTGNVKIGANIMGANSATVVTGNSGTLSVLSDNYFTLSSSFVIQALTASTSYYWSTNTGLGVRTTVDQATLTIPYNATLVGASISAWNSGSSTSQTNSTLNFRINGSDNIISSAVLWNTGGCANCGKSINVTGLNISVTAGDYWENKLTLGALATAPNNGNVTVTYYFARK